MVSAAFKNRTRDEIIVHSGTDPIVHFLKIKPGNGSPRDVTPVKIN